MPERRAETTQYYARAYQRDGAVALLAGERLEQVTQPPVCRIAIIRIADAAVKSDRMSGGHPGRGETDHRRR
jgi:hypothetical protein